MTLTLSLMPGWWCLAAVLTIAALSWWMAVPARYAANNMFMGGFWAVITGLFVLGFILLTWLVWAVASLIQGGPL